MSSARKASQHEASEKKPNAPRYSSNINKQNSANAANKNWLDMISTYSRVPAQQQRSYPTIQRKCDECEEQDLAVQTKLRVGTADDKYEREADYFADQVVKGDAIHSPKQQPLPITQKPKQAPARKPEAVGAVSQAKSSNNSSKDVSSYLSTLTGRGSALSRSENSYYSSRFGHSFNEVRVHTDSRANKAAKGLGAKAFTYGNHVVFNRGQYQPDTQSGKHLMAHELTHVLQQNASRAATSELIQRNPEDEAPQNTEAPIIVDDALPSDCGDVDASGVNYIKDFLNGLHGETANWESWRNQENWDNSQVSSYIPSMNALMTVYSNFSNQDLPCSNSDSVSIPTTHSTVRSFVFNGIDGVDGISGRELDLMGEWMRYTRNQSNGLQDYLGLTPGSDVEHSYAMRVIAASGESDDIAAAGAGLGGAVETPVGKIKLGCFLKVGIGGGYVIFSYSNNVGMTWEQGFLQGNVGLSGECAIAASLGPSVSTNLGSEDLCAGSASEDSRDTWYGPDDFTGGTLEQGIDVSGGLGLVAGIGASYLAVFPAGKDNIIFNTSGACTELEIGGNLSLPSVNILQGGGQVSVGSFEGTPGTLESAGGESRHDLSNTNERVLTRYLYFDTANDDPQLSSSAESNLNAINAVIASISQNIHNDPYVNGIRVNITGHASPRFESAADAAAANQENQELAMRRAENSSMLIYDAVNNYPEGIPPISIVLSGTCEPGDLAAEIDNEIESRGSELGLQETADRHNNFQRYRKVDIHVYVDRLVDDNVSRQEPEVNACYTEME